MLLMKIKTWQRGEPKKVAQEAIRLNIRLMINYDDKNYIASGGRTRGKKKFIYQLFYINTKKEFNHMHNVLH